MDDEFGGFDDTSTDNIDFSSDSGDSFDDSGADFDDSSSDFNADDGLEFDDTGEEFDDAGEEFSDENAEDFEDSTDEGFDEDTDNPEGWDTPIDDIDNMEGDDNNMDDSTNDLYDDNPTPKGYLDDDNKWHGSEDDEPLFGPDGELRDLNDEEIPLTDEELNGENENINEDNNDAKGYLDEDNKWHGSEDDEPLFGEDGELRDLNDEEIPLTDDERDKYGVSDDSINPREWKTPVEETEKIDNEDLYKAEAEDELPPDVPSEPKHDIPNETEIMTADPDNIHINDDSLLNNNNTDYTNDKIDGNNDFNKGRYDIVDSDTTAGRGSCAHICACLDLVGNDRIGDAVHTGNAADLDNVGACASYVGTHGVEEVREVYDVGFLSRVFDNGKTLCAACGEHDVHGSAYRNHVEVDVRSDKTLFLVACGFDDRAVYESGLSAESLKALEVLVDRANAEVTAAGQRNLSLAVFTEQRAEKIVGSSHASYQICGR